MIYKTVDCIKSYLFAHHSCEDAKGGCIVLGFEVLGELDAIQV